MKQILKNIGYYLGIPIVFVIGIIFVLNLHFHDLEKSVSVSATIIQSLAIFIGGLWAYHKFDWGKRAESAIKIKAMLMEYEQIHSEAATQYRLDQQAKKDWMECWTGYAMRMIPARNAFVSQVHLSCYLPKKLRKKVFDVVFLSINNGKSPKSENLDENWKKFGEEMVHLSEDLDNVVSK